MPFLPCLGDSDRHQLLGLARMTLEHVVRQQTLPELRSAGLPAALHQAAACFVSLSHRGQLRGCIGNLGFCHPLYQGVSENTRSAALTDSRFERLQPFELGGIRIEISVLTELQPLCFVSPDQLITLLRPHLDGVVLHLDNHLTTFLPQVWDQISDPTAFLNRLAQKAGREPNAWRLPHARISVYQADVFAQFP
jgi:AmmeMemoRadiSam system protein A